MSHDLFHDLSRAASFTDEASADTRFTDGYKVAVAATIPNDDPLKWHCDLLASMGQASGEVKSNAALAKLNDLSNSARNSILAGMRSARIHVCDQRPYRDELEVNLSGIIGDRAAFDALRAAARRGDERANIVVNRLNETVARSILIDSPVRSLAHRLRAMIDQLGGKSSVEGDIVGLDRLITRLKDQQGKGVLRQTIEFAVKASAAFGEADEAASGSDYVSTLQRFGSAWFAVSPRMRKSLRTLLTQLHVFDKGNERVVGILETIRSNLVDVLAEHESAASVESTGLITIDSIVSPHVQAADIAAGYARAIYQQPHGLVELTRRFHSVTFNGMRVGEVEAEQVLRRWKAVQRAA